MASENAVNERISLLVKGLSRTAVKERHDLNKKLRLGESIIKASLIACGVLSIFTTIGIILVLSQESIGFFTRQLWSNSNKSLATNISPQDTNIPMTTSGATLSNDSVIKVGDEVMHVIAFQNNIIKLESIGTGAGLERFCAAGSTLDIANASRPITENERATCQANDREPIEFRVGTDALAITVNAENTFVDSLTLEELKLVFGSAQTWADVRTGWPAEPITRFTPGTSSGTFDYFVEEVFDNDEQALLSATPNMSESDEMLVGGIRRDNNAVGFFGFAYYLANKDALRLVPIEGVTPDAGTVENGSYALARPLFIYSDARTMQAKPQVAAFINFYLTHANDLIREVGYFPSSVAAINTSKLEWLNAMGLDAEVAGDETVILPEVDPTTLGGEITSAGSSTVYLLSKELDRRFIEAGFLPHAAVERGYQGTQAIALTGGTTIEVEEKVTLTEFLTNTQWIPAIGEFGVLPLINATFMTSIIAILVALPLGLGAAIYLSEYAPHRVRTTLKPILEVLAGIPTVVYGYFALTFMTPLLRSIFGVEVVDIYNTASAGIVIGILITPLVSSLSEDALHAVPTHLREASFGLGATKLETTFKVVIPAALSGILAAFIVAASRAVGETMVVAIAAGAGPNFTFNPFKGAETMTGHIARISGGDLSYGSIDYNSIFAIGLMLFLITLTLNFLSRVIISRFREAY